MTQDRYRGALVGLGVGDATGTTAEFSPPGSFQPITGMRGGGPYALNPGEWTDDTSMALCLAESLVEKGGFDPVDQLERYLRWYREGHLSSNGQCFDIGNTVRAALERFERTRESYCGSTHPKTAGNGSIMRLAPVPMAYAQRPELAIERAGDSSRTTHAAPEAVDACRYMAGLIAGALNGAGKEEILAPMFAPVTGYWDEKPLSPRIEAIARGSFKRKDPPAIRGDGYVVRSLEAALWALDRGNSFTEGLLLAVNLGDDADTTGAVYGQIAGALYGLNAIGPDAGRIALRDTVLHLADRLLELSATIGS